MTIKYILHTGEMTDSDGNTVWIDGDQLARLYGVAMSECLILNPDETDKLQCLVPENATHLYILEDSEQAAISCKSRIRTSLR
jgi:hypothetical protein